MKKGMTLQQHADAAMRVQLMAAILLEMRQTAWTAYPVQGKINARLHTAEKALTRLRSELEESFYQEHPEVAHGVGFPHYTFDALDRLEIEADRAAPTSCEESPDGRQ